MQNTLSELQTVDAYVAERRNIWSSIWSWVWFERQHREELAKAGAVVVLRRRKLVNPPVCDAVVLKIGKRTAAKVS